MGSSSSPQSAAKLIIINMSTTSDPLQIDPAHMGSRPSCDSSSSSSSSSNSNSNSSSNSSEHAQKQQQQQQQGDHNNNHHHHYPQVDNNCNSNGMPTSSSSKAHKVKKGLWSPDEDEKLRLFITTHGHSACWSSIPKLAGHHS